MKFKLKFTKFSKTWMRNVILDSHINMCEVSYNSEKVASPRFAFWVGNAEKQHNAQHFLFFFFLLFLQQVPFRAATAAAILVSEKWDLGSSFGITLIMQSFNRALAPASTGRSSLQKEWKMYQPDSVSRYQIHRQMDITARKIINLKHSTRTLTPNT